MHSLIRGVFGLVYETPAGRALQPHVLSLEEITQLLSTIQNRTISRRRRARGGLKPLTMPRYHIKIRDHLMVSLIYRYGLTQDEPGRILVSDLDLERATIYIRRVEGTSRTYPLFPDLIPLAVDWKHRRPLPQHCGPAKCAVLLPPPEEDHLFPHTFSLKTADGPRLQGITAKSITRILVDTEQLAQLSRPKYYATPAALRRAIGAHLAAANWHPDEVAFHLGLDSPYTPTIAEYRERLKSCVDRHLLASLAT